jgi:hypothetical protein
MKDKKTRLDTIYIWVQIIASIATVGGLIFTFSTINESSKQTEIYMKKANEFYDIQNKQFLLMQQQFNQQRLHDSAIVKEYHSIANATNLGNQYVFNKQKPMWKFRSN